MMGIMTFEAEQNVSSFIAPGSSYWKPNRCITKELNILKAACTADCSLGYQHGICSRTQ